MKIYPTDLSDAEFRHIEPHLPVDSQRGRARIHGLRDGLNGVFYVLKSGCPWRLLPRDFPPWKTVYHWFRAWRIDGTWERLNAVLRQVLRARLGRNHEPTAGCVDTDLPIGQCNYARSDKSVGESACLHHAMWVDHTETCCSAGIVDSQ
jgi:transposase